MFQDRQSRLQDVVRGPAADRDQPAGGGERQPFRAAARRIASFAAAAEIGRVSIVVRAGRRKRPGGDLRHALRAAGRIGIEHLGDQRPDPQVDRAEIGHLAALLEDRDLAAAHVDRLAGQRFDQHEPETVDVGLGLHVAAEQPELLGRHVVVLAGKAAADDRPVAQLRRARDAEVDDLGARHVAARDHDVVGRDVAVDDAALVRRMQPGGDALEQRTHRLVGQRLRGG